jgi:Domain of unknown function (DUF4397)
MFSQRWRGLILAATDHRPSGERFMKRLLFRAGAAAVTAIALGACGVFDDDDDPTPTPVAQANLRAIHASADTPAVDVFVNGMRALPGVTFGQASAFNAIAAGTTRVQVSLANQPASATEAS